jgi:hypothetical protein
MPVSVTKLAVEIISRLPLRILWMFLKPSEQLIYTTPSEAVRILRFVLAT